MKKLMILAAFLSVLSISAHAEAHDYYNGHKSYKSPQHHGKQGHHPAKYQPLYKTVVVYPPSCYAVKVDWFGHHSRVLRQACRQNAQFYTKVYYSPQQFSRR